MVEIIHSSRVDWDKVDMVQIRDLLMFVELQREHGFACPLFDRMDEIVATAFDGLITRSPADRGRPVSFIQRHLLRDLLSDARHIGLNDTLARVNAHTKTAMAMALYDRYVRPEIRMRMVAEGWETIPRYIDREAHDWPNPFSPSSYRRCACRPPQKSQRRP